MTKFNFHCAILSLAIIICNCTSSHQNNEVVSKPEIDKQQTINEQHDDTLTRHRDLPLNSITNIYIDKMSKFYNHPDHYVSLFYFNNFSDETYQELVGADIGTVFQDSEIKRTAIDKKIAKKHLIIENLEKLLVFDKHQKLIDTIQLHNVEYYEDMIESSFLATYQTDLPDENYLVMSLDGVKQQDLKKSPVIHSDSLYLQHVITKNQYKPSGIYSFGYFIQNTDTFSILSFAEYKAGKECIYLLKNQTAVDSVMNDFVIIGMYPVPLADDSESLYVSEIAIPDTDARWNSLTGVNTKTNKIVFYSRNQKEL